jgi:hypothetical protein
LVPFCIYCCPWSLSSFYAFFVPPFSPFLSSWFRVCLMLLCATISSLRAPFLSTALSPSRVCPLLALHRQIGESSPDLTSCPRFYTPYSPCSRSPCSLLTSSTSSPTERPPALWVACCGLLPASSKIISLIRCASRRSHSFGAPKTPLLRNLTARLNGPEGS